MVQSKLSSLSGELEAAGQKAEAKTVAIRKEVSKALQDQRQQLINQAETMVRRMDAVTVKVARQPKPPCAGLSRLNPAVLCSSSCHIGSSSQLA